MSLIRSTATIGGFTLISRVFGFIRDIAIASSLGASMLSDAFFVAFKLPNFLRRLFAEGAFNSAFVPQFAGRLAVEGKDSAKKLADEANSYLFMVLIGVTAVFITFMPWLMVILAPGFSDNPEKYDLTVTLTRITFPYIIFISLVSLLGGILNSFSKFAAVAATPIVMNLCLIAAPYVFKPITPTPAHALALGVLIAGVAQWLWLIYFCRKLQMLPKFQRPRLTPNVRKLLILIGPAALGAGVAQINLFIDLIIASQIENGVSYLYYADRVNELPLAVIGIAVGTALLPLLSRQIREGKKQEANYSQNRAIELAVLLSLPAGAALMVIAEPVIRVMFERGAFGAKETDATFRALVAFAAGLPAFVLVKVLTPAFFANQDTKTPFKIATVCIMLNLSLNLLLIDALQHVGMAVATSVASWVNVVLLSVILYKRDLFTPDRSLFKRLPRIMLACMAMCVVLYYLMGMLQPYFGEPMLIKTAALVVLVGIGLAVYALLLQVMGVATIGQLRGYLKRRAK